MREKEIKFNEWSLGDGIGKDYRCEVISLQIAAQLPVICVSGSSSLHFTHKGDFLASEGAVKACERRRFFRNRSATQRGCGAYSPVVAWRYVGRDALTPLQLQASFTTSHLNPNSKLFLEAGCQMLGVLDLPNGWLPPCISWKSFVQHLK